MWFASRATANGVRPSEFSMQRMSDWAGGRPRGGRCSAGSEANCVSTVGEEVGEAVGKVVGGEGAVQPRARRMHARILASEFL